MKRRQILFGRSFVPLLVDSRGGGENREKREVGDFLGDEKKMR